VAAEHCDDPHLQRAASVAEHSRLLALSMRCEVAAQAHEIDQVDLERFECGRDLGAVLLAAVEVAGLPRSAPGWRGRGRQ
jgi:hypothetical protein